MLAASGPAPKTASMACKKYLPWRNRARHAGGHGNTVVRCLGGGAGVPSRGRPANVHAWSNFITRSYIRTRETPCRNTPARAFWFFHCSPDKLVRSLSSRSCPACLWDLPIFIVKVVETCSHRLHYGLAAAILRSSARRFRIAEYSNRPPQVHLSVSVVEN